ncbi:MAG: RNA polymerase sigma factor [Acidobacteriota bacterium]|nr:RNA polymerase sigma factor [Acidobacteriota bacterium]
MGPTVRIFGEQMPHLVHTTTKPVSEQPAGDRDLLLAIQRGDEEAFAELLDRKTGPLLALTHRMVWDREEARDLVQVTFLRVWEHRHKFDERFSPNTWLYRIATNLAIDFLRAKRTRLSKLEPVRQHLYRVVKQPDTNLEEILERDILSVLQDLTSALTERQRLAFVLGQIEGLSTREVASILECRESTVRNHLFAARKVLQGELLRRFPEYAGRRRTGKQ